MPPRRRAARATRRAAAAQLEPPFSTRRQPQPIFSHSRDDYIPFDMFSHISTIQESHAARSATRALLHRHYIAEFYGDGTTRKNGVMARDAACVKAAAGERVHQLRAIIVDETPSRGSARYSCEKKRYGARGHHINI